jgi:hypothetical protein
MGNGYGAHLPWLQMHRIISAIVAIVMDKVNERFIDLLYQYASLKLCTFSARL